MHKTSCTNEARADYDIKQNAVNTVVEFGICYHTFFKKRNKCDGGNYNYP